ncbi:ADP-ribose glycohydrolase ARH3-like [Stegodyphus dumicola]|uniref:ADP-ribose glycohydrolase ARH3-like n=1 Tax=Stegodyphus dumicola TaxID=202533 RepID=UPI0015AFB941|nr:ADP-ribose glycohydrolase ARH3-like [Stegodyphus dumicola]
MLASKFRGCMIGALMGDCLGAPFEGDSRVSNRVLSNYFNSLTSGESIQIFPYTDDTAMTLSVAKSLVENGTLDPKDMAKRFVTEFYNQPKRGYGMNVVNVFRALKETHFEDVFLPATSQFNGSGSYGNGAAMRIAPIALFGSKKGEDFIRVI